MTPRNPLPQQALLDYWRAQLTEAKEKYSLAADQYRTASRDFRDRALLTPDGGLNLNTCLQAENKARDEYMRVLHIFTALVMTGKVPE